MPAVEIAAQLAGHGANDPRRNGEHDETRRASDLAHRIDANDPGRQRRVGGALRTSRKEDRGGAGTGGRRRQREAPRAASPDAYLSTVHRGKIR